VRIVIAIGGNAITGEHERGTWDEQRANALTVAHALTRLSASGHELVLTHGNGPQVGALYTQHARGAAEVPRLPLDALVAMTQGQLGYLLQSAIEEVDPRVRTVTVLSRVTVDPDDPACAAAGSELAVAPDAGRGWRTVVASPEPREIVEVDHLKLLVGSGLVVIATGGGGIPVRRRDGRLHGTEAVIDKDRASAALAAAVNADLLVLLTAVERVALDFGTRWQRDMARLTVSDAHQLCEAGEFPPGSMGPKVESAVRFAAAGGRSAIVTCAERLQEAVEGTAGTRIVADADGPSATAWTPPHTVAA
jgi:carbamate kinase